MDSKWRHSRAGRILAGLLLVGALAVGTALAVHDLGLFELDANAIDSNGYALAPDDWETLYAGEGSAAKFTGILNDVTGAGTQFQGGGSKDNNDIDQWLWKAGEPLDKDDITDAYAAAYVSPEGHLVLYYGLDRFANNGSAQVGFWFFQNPVATTNVPQSGGFKFSGVHAVGDVLVQSNFSQGGTIDTISVFKWVGSGGSNGALHLLANAQDCLRVAGGDLVCATVNKGDTTSPWPYTPKSGSPGTFPQGSFFEGGIDITALVPEAGCFATFLAETRSSTPFDSRLKDFVAGGFEVCALEVTKTGDLLGKVGDAVSYTVTIQNTGAMKLYKDDISDTLLGPIAVNGVDQPNAYVTSNGCGAVLLPGAACTITFSRVVQAGDPDPLPNTVTAVYRGKADLGGAAISDADDHSVNLFQPAIELTKAGDELSKIGDAVTYTITLDNLSSADTPDLTCAIEDAKAGFSKQVTLSAGASDVSTVPFTIPAGAADPFVNTAKVTCSPAGFPNVLTDEASWSTNLFQPAIRLTKTGDALSKIGDAVSYVITLHDESSADTPELTCTVTDAMLGVNQTFAVASGASHPIEVKDFVIPAGAADPFVNTANVTCSPKGFPNVLTAEASWSVNLFQPAMELTKAGDALSKIGDKVSYLITLANKSSADTPNLGCTVTDAMLGVSETFSLAPGASHPIEVKDFVIPVGAADPFVNTATATCSPAGFPNVLTGEASWSVNLFQPAIAIDKTGDALSKMGDTVNYTITVTDQSSADTPALACTLSDPMLGIVNEPFNLTLAAPYTRTASYLVTAGYPDPLVNTASVTCSPVGFPNVLAASDTHEVDLVHPGLEVAKTCAPAVVRAGETISYACTISNTGDVALLRIAIGDSLRGDLTNPVNYSSSTCGEVLAAGASCTVAYTLTAPTGTPTLVNTVTARYQVQGLSNVLEKSSSCSVQIPSEGCTPGFWKNHPGMWDSFADPIALKAGFTTATSFNAFFALTPSQSGFPDTLTMIGALELGGGGGEKLARHGVAALLSIASGINYPYSDPVALRLAIRSAYLTGAFEPLATDLAAANSLKCPF